VIAVAEELKKLGELLQDSDLYDIAAAIRGPDIYFGDGLKYALTLPIRHIVIFGNDPVDEILSHMTPEELDSIFDDLKYMEGNLGTTSVTSTAPSSPFLTSSRYHRP